MGLSYTYEEVKNVFKEKGYTLLSDDYKSCKDKLLCIDEKGYKLLITFDKFINRKTLGSRFHPSNPHTIDNINHFAELNGIKSKCVSNKYINANTCLEFVCDCGEHFYTNWSIFSSNHKIKCDKCSGNPRADKDYDTIKNNLLKFGYYLETSEYQYIGVTTTPLVCHDIEGYKYKVTYDQILRGKKPNAISKSNEFSIDNINTYLKIHKKEFKCISTEFISRNHLLEFVCLRCGDHIFSKWCNMYKSDNSNRNIIKCPNCDIRTESVHAIVLKQMFKHYYPDTIEEEKSCINPLTGCILPTDIVNHKLKIAIEIQSEWHDKEYQKIKDKIKKNYWINKGYKFYDPDIRDYSVLEICKLFFDINDIPDFINFNYGKKINVKDAQELLDKNLSPKKVSEILNVNVHQVYDAIYSKKLHYSDSYVRDDYTPVVQLDMHYKYINEFTTIKEARDSTGCRNISNAIVSKTHFNGGYYWFKKEDYYNNFILNKETA